MSDPVRLLDRKLLFVTGKGGVGKSSVASALGLLAARNGLRTLVCEVDAKGNLADFYSSGPLVFEPTEVQANLWAMAMNTEDSLREYLKLQLRVPIIARLGPLARTFDFVATAAPGVKEILTVGKLAWEVRERHYDLVIVDSPATGHVIGQLASPEALGELVRVGPIRQQTQWMTDLLTDPGTTGVVVVTTPEEMPVNEALELIERLDNETGIDLAAVVANRVLPELFSVSEEARFEQIAATRASWSGTGVPAALGTVIDAARLASDLRRGKAAHLARLQAALDPDVQMLMLPMLFVRSHGVRATRQLAAMLGDEL